MLTPSGPLNVSRAAAGRPHNDVQRNGPANSGESFRSSVLSILHGGSASLPGTSELAPDSGARQFIATNSGTLHDRGLRLTPTTSPSGRKSAPKATPGPPSPSTPPSSPPVQPAAAPNSAPV